MKLSRLVIALLGMVLFTVVITPLASAGPDPIDGMWWRES